MHNISTRALVASISALAIVSLSAFASSQTIEQDPLFSTYETIRTALVEDSLGGVDDAAKALADHSKAVARTTSDSFTKEAAEAISASATALSSMEDLESVREGFATLSKAMVRYRHTVLGAKPVVVYCPMAQKPWLQPSEEIGNPYFGQAMARCGEIVSGDDQGS